MPCSKVSINNNFKCDKAECICIPTYGKPCICVCENENGDIVRCDNCKCSNSDTCQCKCDDSKCTCIATKGADCICLSRDGRGNVKAYDCCFDAPNEIEYCKKGFSGCDSKQTKREGCSNCKCNGKRNFDEMRCHESGNMKTCDSSCIATKDTRCCKKDRTFKSCECCSKKEPEPEKETCGSNCKCGGKKYFKESRRTVAISKDYKCVKAECVCIPTGGKSCICLCENENGEIIRCDDCKCSNSDTCQCKCDDSKCTCIVTKGADCICVCRDGRGYLKVCNCSCIETKYARCCKKELTLKSCEFCKKEPEPEIEACRNCKCDGNNNFKESRRAVTVLKNYKCGKAEYVCIPAGGKSCICICENENGEITRCDDCKCSNSDTCQCKCDDSKCTCIVSKGADCICLYSDGRGNIKTYDCCFNSPNKKEVSVKLNGSCYCKQTEKEACGSNCRCDGKENFKKSQHAVTFSKNYKCLKAECVCIPTGGKSCICICENENGEITQCDNCKCSNSDTCQCKCDDSKCTCIVTKGVDCICVCRDVRGNLKVCNCSCIGGKGARCYKKDLSVNGDRCCIKEQERAACGSNCKCDGKENFKETRHHESGNIKTYDCSCIETQGTRCSKKELIFKSCECCKKIPKKEACDCNCKCDGEQNFEEPRRTVTISKT